MRTDFDIHKRKSKVERLLKKVKNESISEANRKALLKFYDFCSAEGLTLGRLEKLMGTMLNLTKLLKKDFRQATKDDIIKLVQKIDKQGYSEYTKYDYKVILKKFYKWYEGDGEVFPEKIRWLKPKLFNNKRKLPEELLTEEEIVKLVAAADNIRDKALIFSLYESGCRIGELISLRIRNVQFDDLGAVLIVTGKTGDRRVRLVASASLLANWIDNHPDRDNPDSPIWVSIGAKNRNEIVGYSAVSMMLKTVAKKAKIRKKIHAHLFRHSRATHLAKHLTEAQMKHVFGWTQDSDMASTYVHLSGRDTDDAILKLHGVVSEEKQEVKLKPTKCARCKLLNAPTARFCQRCALPLSMPAVIEAENKRKGADDWLTEIVQSPVVRAAILEEAKRKGLDKKLVEI